MKRRVKSADSFNNLYYDVESVGNMNIDRENDDDLPIFSIDGQLLRSPNFSRTDTTINQDLIVNENIEQTETSNRNRCLDYCYLTKTEAFIIGILSSILCVTLVFIIASAGSRFDAPGTNKTSSNVSASRMSIGLSKSYRYCKRHISWE